MKEMRKMTFLDIVAQDIITKYGDRLADVTVVFPNKRASLFLNDALVKTVGHTIWSPAYVTISELFRQQSKLKVGDEILLVSMLYKSFVKCTGVDESFDHFYGWGQLLLADFDDLDKNMAPASKVFSNVSNLHELDGVEYLTDTQKKLLQQFFSSFSLTQETLLRERFIALWSHIYDIYIDFNRSIAARGITYEGALYRSVVEGDGGVMGAMGDASQLILKSDMYLFVGFNVVQTVEQRLFRMLMSEGKARFYWDIDKFFFTDDGKAAGSYIRSYMQMFPNELDNTDDALFDNYSKLRDVSVISSTTETAQARYVGKWLTENDRYKAGRRTVIVMCNENLLPEVVNSLPPQCGSVNITTGYSLQQSPASSLFNVLWELQVNGRTSGGWYLARYVNAVLRHPYMRFLSEKVPAVVADISQRHLRVIKPSDLCLDDSLGVLFGQEELSGDADAPSLLQWIEDVVALIARATGGDEESQTPEMGDSSTAIMQEALFRLYTLTQRVHNLVKQDMLPVTLFTLRRIFAQIVSSTSVPFHGEPATGVQIMGVLETRNLDFDHVLLLSASESNIPRGINDSSFIPHSIRKAYGLTTVDNKVAVYAYYFYRLLCRASDVTIMYNASTQGSSTGEASRFVTQLMVGNAANMTLSTLRAGQSTPDSGDVKGIVKDEAVMEKLYSLCNLYPTGLNEYLRCPCRFYFHVVAGLREPDNGDEMDARQFGNIFHEVMESIYRRYEGKGAVPPGDIEAMIKHKQQLQKVVDDVFAKVMKLPDGRYYHQGGMITIGKSVILTYVVNQLKMDKTLAQRGLYVKALEKEVRKDITFNTKHGEMTVSVGGKVDRLDVVVDEAGSPVMRVIDYKTGSKQTRTPAGLDESFERGTDKHNTHADNYLQAILYSDVIRFNKTINPDGLPVVPALLFIKFNNSGDTDVALKFGKTPIADVADLSEEFDSRLRELLEEIYNPDCSFAPAADTAMCKSCPYAALCK